MSLKKNLLAGLACIIVSSTGANAADFTFKYANDQPESAIRSKSMTFFKTELEQRTNGRIEVQNYFSGMLGTEREMMDQLTTGLLQGTRGGMFAEASAHYNIFLLPFLVENWDQMECLVRSDFTKKVQGAAAANGYHIPATGISQGFRAHTNNVRALTKVDDIKGLKMRVPQQEVYIETAKALGASPQAMPFSEAYQAFKMGVIDGQDNPPANIWDFKVQEVQKFMSITNYSTGPDPLIVNKAWYDGLPADLQKTFDEVATDALALSDKMYRQSEAELIEKMTEYLEVNYVEGEALKGFQDAVQPVYDIFVGKGAFTIDDVKAAKAAARSCS
ncbi:TRAP transporter substrate-binding protein [Pseudovibrio sp. Tun.PSC04-5.I4]|uniref:TRAP transporter substrate-binding protein n=1 Tax=Pseudovibrio sp. Tun.PSC04-5.I4 TaxID=1798213 RepID=UPI00087E851D|nr:TRAP transporter substrate-binding protein [Pseudovibrio sp. Tun.PSC04-5.I4]SDQ14145.1 tripartite ATP-independent transporter solute receptor, DctP family [Pseudovibrio sp. Tun.PSC04-5.I4]